MGNASIAFTIVGLWFLFDLIPLPQSMEGVFTTTSFVYFFHGPFIFMINKWISAHWSEWLCGEVLDWYYLVKCLTYPVLSVAVAIFIRRFSPRMYSVLSGGRI